jgi:hypothetical protein
VKSRSAFTLNVNPSGVRSTQRRELRSLGRAKLQSTPVVEKQEA